MKRVQITSAQQFRQRVARLRQEDPPPMENHHFPLRPGLSVEVALPADMTRAEAVRLGAWAQLLPPPQPWGDR